MTAFEVSGSELPEDIAAALREAQLYRADCRRRQVAAVAVCQGRIRGIGWNMLAVGSCTKGDCPRGLMSYAEVPAFSSYSNNCAAIHAEDMALTEALSQGGADTIYVTCRPCPDCRILCEDAGVQVVVVNNL